MEDLKYAEGAQLVRNPSRQCPLNTAAIIGPLSQFCRLLGPPLGGSQMALQTTGEITVGVDRDSAFKFIQVPEQLAKCIPGCSDLRETAPGIFTAVLTSEVSFMTLSFQVTVEVVKITPPDSIEAKITGKPVGFSGQLMGTAKLHLAAAGQGRTTIRHSSDIGLTGKLGGMGQPVFRAKSAEMTAKFGANLKAALEKNGAGNNASGEGPS
jgi:carbon monoxide dehydrogenase subunit G